MNERGTGVLEQYGLDVQRTCRTRGAVLCETSQGLKLLKEWTGSDKRIQLEYEVLSALGEETGLQVDCCMKNLEGNLVSVDEDQSRYVLRNWYEGRECNTREVGEILTAAELLARLHRGLRKLELEHVLDRKREESLLEEREKRKRLANRMREEAEAAEAEAGIEAGAEAKAASLYEFSGEPEEAELPSDTPCQSPECLSELLGRHNRELRRTRAYVKGRKRKTDFELVVIGGFEKFYRQAEEAAALSDKLEAMPDFWWCHGEYSHHHVLLGGRTRAVTDFSRMRRDIQVSDLYYFTRKILEKHRWNLNLGRQILDVYAASLPLSHEEWQYLYILFLYPEKYWKQINYYVNSNKAWIPARNVDKLKVLENQFEPREQFLEELKERL
ncbi:protein kinase family protein [Qiania dongpingensis]|uniref:Spore coat protein CotS n=1 Tax=Qiania dongpingensis TaxID=2763669 RepID=A0A7G9G0Q6_9FIRM|nr:spore coat protein CotS [Qiania dongpingensis]QNM04388.1 spore coat protein CotS [Qiania dongpingensis]